MIRRALLVLSLVAAAALSGACTTAVPGQARPDPVALAEPAPTTAPAPTGRPSTEIPLVVEPVIPGWSPVRSVKRAAIYDVPPTWTVLGEGVIVGYGEPDKGGVLGSGAAEFGKEACGQYSSLALAVTKHDPGTDLTAASQAWAEIWADRAYTDDEQRRPTVTLGPPEQITTITGLPAAIVKAEADLPSPDPECNTTKGAAYVVSATGFTGELGPTVSLIVVADVDSPKSVPEAEIRQILSTLRQPGQGPK
ncbi:hypothetical protein WEH80_28270 [Actinomycetes bacterium KLBMP 9759]